jgi:hypothetical protein
MEKPRCSEKPHYSWDRLLEQYTRAQLLGALFDEASVVQTSKHILMVNQTSPVVLFVETNWRALGLGGPVTADARLNGCYLVDLDVAKQVRDLIHRYANAPLLCSLCFEPCFGTHDGIRWIPRGGTEPLRLCYDCMLSSAVYARAHLRHEGVYADDTKRRERASSM